MIMMNDGTGTTTRLCARGALKGRSAGAWSAAHLCRPCRGRRVWHERRMMHHHASCLNDPGGLQVLAGRGCTSFYSFMSTKQLHPDRQHISVVLMGFQDLKLADRLAYLGGCAARVVGPRCAAC